MRKGKIALLCCILVLCTACGKISVPPVNDSSNDTPEPKAENTSTEATTALSTNAKVFVCGEPSMMGFADWKNDTIYETTVSLLLDKLTDYKTVFYRYDSYDLGEIIIPDSSSMKNAVREVSFYATKGLTAEGSIPGSVNRYKNDQIGSITSVDAYIPSETLETAGAAEKFPFENALRLFSKNALNIVVSDLYELRNGSFELMNELKGYDVGVLAIQSEYSGTLPNYTADGSEVIWGSPRTGAYKSHTVKTQKYTKNDGTTGTYNYNVFSGYSTDDRTTENRTFYIIFAGKGTQVADVMSGVRTKLLEKYANSTTIIPVVDVFGFYSGLCKDMAVDTGKAVEYIILDADEIPGSDGDYGFEIRADDDVPPLKVSAKYPVDKGTGARAYTVQDFELSTVCTKLNGTKKEIDVTTPTLTLGQDGADYITPVLTYDIDELSAGEYMFETQVSVKSTELGNDKGAFLEKWGIEIDDGSLRQLISDYKGGGQEGIDRMRDFMVKTIGLGNLFEHLEINSSVNEILSVEVYFNVV